MAKLCKNCGGALEDNARFCVLCGTKVEEIPVVQQPMPENGATTTTVPMDQQAIPQQSYQQTNNTQIMEVAPINTNLTQQSDVLVPSGANINVGAMVEEKTPAFQSMPEFDTPKPEVQTPPPSVAITPQINNDMANPKRKRKKKNDLKILYIISGIIGSIVVLAIIGIAIAFFQEANEGNGDNSTKKTNLTEKNSYRVGSKDYGYVSVPNSWTPFGIDETNQTIQYSDGTGWIVTLFSVDEKTISSKDWANSIINQMRTVGASEIGMEETKINQYSGYKIFGYYSNVTTYLAAWVVEGNDGKNHYIAIEGPNRYDDNYDIVYTFNTEK